MRITVPDTDNGEVVFVAEPQAGEPSRFVVAFAPVTTTPIPPPPPAVLNQPTALKLRDELNVFLGENGLYEFLHKEVAQLRSLVAALKDDLKKAETEDADELMQLWNRACAADNSSNALKIALAREENRTRNLRENNEELKKKVAWLERDVHDLKVDNERLRHPAGSPVGYFVPGCTGR